MQIEWKCDTTSFVLLGFNVPSLFLSHIATYTRYNAFLLKQYSSGHIKRAYSHIAQ